MISVNDFKTGLTIQIDGELWRGNEFLHLNIGGRLVLLCF